MPWYLNPKQKIRDGLAGKQRRIQEAKSKLVKGQQQDKPINTEAKQGGSNGNKGDS